MTEVRFSDITKTYGAVRAIDCVSMTIPSGQFTTILGPSGSGKTTILSLIAGIIAPSSGRIEIGARDITYLPASERNTGLVFQSYALFPHMTIFDNIAFPLRLRKVAAPEVARRVEEVLGRVRLEGFAKRKPDQLSGGQQQRVALARAIVFKPDILLLDEPLAALDRNLREEVRIEIRALQHSLGITTVMVTHDQEEAMSLSDLVVLMSHGRIEQVGSPDQLYHRPQNRFTAGFLGSANFLEGRWTDGAIRSEAGEVFPCRGEGLAGNAQVTGLLRPDAVSLANGGEGLAARVIDVDFLGEVVRYSLRTGQGQVLRAHVTGQHERYREGAEVRLSWDPARVWILPEQGAGDGEERDDPDADGTGQDEDLQLKKERIVS
ncbi:MAG: ABC transporter ATP-binding protein [Rhodospirillales bacterium]